MNASDIAQVLARNAEAVCRHYLPNGRREGGYWHTGDVTDTSGRSLFVRVQGPQSGKGAVGRWSDAATGEHGDLLDLIAAARGLELREALSEARRFLALPQRTLAPAASAPYDATIAARRLFTASTPIRGTLAEAYLHHRGIEDLRGCEALRFHPRCFYRARSDALFEPRPALIAAITDANLNFAGVQRTWLDPSGKCKAGIATPRRTLGSMQGNGVRFGLTPKAVVDTISAGEGIETMLALRMAAPALPVIAALSASNLPSLVLPPTLKRLYIAVDNDRAGRRAASKLADSTSTAGIDARILVPQLDDFNGDLCTFGLQALREQLRNQFTREDVGRFLVL
jgi:hypothetical protein